MKIAHHKIIALICFSFSLDSLLKIPLGGINIHVGLSFLVAGMGSLLIRRRFLAEFILFAKENLFLSLYVLYCILQFPLASSNSTFFFVLIFLIIPYVLYFYIYSQKDKIRYKPIFLAMLLTVLSGGIIQMAFFYILDHQITLGGVEDSYYDKGTSVDSRVRGFFLEPNWFGLFLTFCLIGYLATIRRYSLVIILLSFLIALLAYLSGNRLSNFFVLLTLMVFVFSSMSKPLLSFSTLILGSIPILFFLYSVIGLGDGGATIEDRSLSARTLTAAKVLIFIFLNFDFQDYIIGLGFSNWSEVALENSLTSRSELLESGSALRDTSESYIFLLEGGLLGCLFIFLDSLRFVLRTYKFYPEKGLTAMIASLFLFSAAFYYPIFFFMPYLIPYFLIRTFCQIERRV